MKLKRNRAQCRVCNDIVESTFRHDFVSCSCGEIFVDGGLAYARAGAKNFENFIDMVEYEKEENDQAK